MSHQQNTYDEASHEAVELGNRLADRDEQADIWDIADGLLAGAIQYWLYTRQPCSNPACEECAPIRMAEQRLEELLRLGREFAESSEYFHSPNDHGAGRA